MNSIWTLQILGAVGAVVGGVLPIGHGCPDCQVTSVPYSPLPAVISNIVLPLESRIIPVPTPTITSPAQVQASKSDCIPHSVCVDGFSCGVRWGGCYDELYCDGNTSPIPVPTCDPDPGQVAATDGEDTMAPATELEEGAGGAAVVSSMLDD